MSAALDQTDLISEEVSYRAEPRALDSSQYFTAALSSVPSADFNQDHSVDGLDLDYWMQNYSSAVNSGADAHGTSGYAFLLWQQQLGDSTTASVGAAPEPSTLAIWALFTTGAAVVMMRRRFSAC